MDLNKCTLPVLILAGLVVMIAAYCLLAVDGNGETDPQIPETTVTPSSVPEETIAATSTTVPATTSTETSTTMPAMSSTTSSAVTSTTSSTALVNEEDTTTSSTSTLPEEDEIDDEGMTMETMETGESIDLPEPARSGRVSVEAALQERRSVRSYKDAPLTVDEVSQLLWAAQGITGADGSKRTSPSAGAIYPLELYLIAGDVTGMAPGVYRYVPEGHRLKKVLEGDYRAALEAAAWDQRSVGSAPADLLFTAVYARMTKKYGEEAVKYVHMEAGHASQNVYLQAVSLGLGTVAVGSFEEEKVVDALELPGEETPLYIMPVGRV